MNDIQTSGGTVAAGAKRAKTLSPRVYNLVVSGLIFIGFCIMGAATYVTGTQSFLRTMDTGAGFGIMIGSFILTIVGLVIMSVAASKESAGLSIVGFIVFAASFGFIASLGLAAYDLPTINTAFAATAAITFIFGALGVMFPQFFKRVAGVGCGIILALVVVELILMLMGVSQTITDYIVVIVFAGFIGYDTYMATTVEPTLPNAVLAASNLYVDIINVFLRILDIVGNRD